MSKSCFILVLLLALELIFIEGFINKRTRCKFQEFRCMDGSKCLKTEQLCDEKYDCPNGEDEVGSVNWNCTYALLNDRNCGDERFYFKCRYGGCIRREQVCDNKIDCWGGCDEALDLCYKGGLRPLPTIKFNLRNLTHKTAPSTTSPPSQGTKALPSSLVTPLPTIIFDENYLSPPIPSQATTIVGSSTQAYSEPMTESDSEPHLRKCDPLPVEEGVTIKCRNPKGRMNDCFDAENGTIAIYECSEHYKQSRNAPIITRRLCKNGVWTKRNPKWYCSLECGKASRESSQFIIGGTVSKVGKFPWHVGFYRQNPDNSKKWDYFCGGTLISTKAVLTAAHCVLGKGEQPLYNIKLMFGKFNRSLGNNDEFVQERGVKSIVVNEHYNPISYLSDIALVEIDKPVKITDRVLPACLPREHDLEPGDTGELVGWGRYNEESYPEELQEATFTVISTKVCREAHPSLELLVNSESFCAGYRNGTSPCDGDSGSGLVSVNQANRWVIFGIVSAGVARRGGIGCDPNFYAVFTRVLKFRHDWIDPILDSNFSEFY